MTSKYIPEKPDESPSGCGLLIAIGLIVYVLYVLMTSL